MTLRPRVCIVQCDTRDSNTGYIRSTILVNKKVACKLKYNYKYIKFTCDKGWDPKAYKLVVFKKIFNSKYYKSNFDTIVFIDSDAWVVNYKMLDRLINSKMYRSRKKIGFISRDPKVGHNTFINSGVFIFKLNKTTSKLFNNLANSIADTPYKNKKWWDQQLVSEYVEQNKQQFIICNDKMLNSPDGKIIAHHWHKKGEISKVCKFNNVCDVFSINQNVDV